MSAPTEQLAKPRGGAVRRVPIAQPLPIALPEPSTRYDQNEEWCLVKTDGQWREYRFHDYDRIYRVAGLYERLFYDVLGCNSPTVVGHLLADELAAANTDPGDLRVLDLGAGNGLVAEALGKHGIEHFVGVDIIPEAKDAMERDRPELYDGFHVLDMANLTAPQRQTLLDYKFNAMTCVAALGFGDIPPTAFQGTFNLVADGGWIAFNIKDDFLAERDPSGFSKLIKDISTNGVLKVHKTHRYQHRMATDGSPLHYFTVIATKHGDITDDMMPAS